MKEVRAVCQPWRQWPPGSVPGRQEHPKVSWKENSNWKKKQIKLGSASRELKLRRLPYLGPLDWPPRLSHIDTPSSGSPLSLDLGGSSGPSKYNLMHTLLKETFFLTISCLTGASSGILAAPPQPPSASGRLAAPGQSDNQRGNEPLSLLKASLWRSRLTGEWSCLD